MQVDIDKESGFCFGVVSAIVLAEKNLSNNNKGLYCLGDIVHNNKEVERLNSLGLKVVNHEEFKQLKNTKVLIRAHGEPPLTYKIARKNSITLIDATCTIVLKLQERIKQGYKKMLKEGGQILIYGKAGHAEVIGLNGQTANNAIVISKFEDLYGIDFTKSIMLFSQTTMNVEDYEKIIKYVKEECSKNNSSFTAINSICNSMSGRAKKLKAFSLNNDIIVFVSDEKSSNGKYLYGICKEFNPNTIFITTLDDLKECDFKKGDKYLFNNVGVCGATSTPMWLMRAAAEKIKNF